MLMKILGKFTVVFLTLTLCITTVACGSDVKQTTSQTSRNNQTTRVSQTRISDGQYPVQQASYNDEDGEYTLFLLNSPTPTYTTDKLQMARLMDEQIKQGEKTYLKVDSGQPVLYLTEDFKIEYVHNVTENRTNPQTGQQETVIVRRESNFWTPFAGALAGQALGSLLFRPQYYVPPVYQSGTILSGYGGYGNSYNAAVDSYRQRYNNPPAAVINRTVFRKTGSLRRSTSNTNVRTPTKQKAGSRSTGSGFGSSKLKNTGKSSSVKRRNSNSNFGSNHRSNTRRPTRSFGSRRGRR
ncbi:MAG: hypothetical protein HRU34_11280 [Richelia sp.]|nr:hypothetical protein [Richelia sp.]